MNPTEIAADPVDRDLSEVLSPSQVRCFMDCQARWWFKYGLKQPDPQTGNLALGKAVHFSLGYNFAQKVETEEDLPTAGVRAVFREAWAIECEQTEFRDDENPAELGATGEALVAKYMDQVAHTIEPAAVELHVEGEISGVKVEGWIDLLDVQGRVIDIKTAKARPSGIYAVPVGPGVHEIRTLHAQPAVNDVLATQLFILALLRKGVGRRGP